MYEENLSTQTLQERFFSFHFNSPSSPHIWVWSFIFCHIYCSLFYFMTWQSFPITSTYLISGCPRFFFPCHGGHFCFLLHHIFVSISAKQSAHKVMKGVETYTERQIRGTVSTYPQLQMKGHQYFERTFRVVHPRARKKNQHPPINRLHLLLVKKFRFLYLLININQITKNICH